MSSAFTPPASDWASFPSASLAHREPMTGVGRPGGDGVSLVDLLDRLLDTGVTLSGDLVLSVAGIDLVWVGLRAIVSSVETARPPDLASVSMPSEAASLGGRASVPGALTVAEGPLGASAATDAPAFRSGEGRPTLPRPAGPETPPPAAQRLDVRHDDVGRGLVQLVLTVVDLLRQLMERQAMTRMERGGLDEEEIERLGSALMQLSERMDDLKETFGLTDEDLTLDLGPIGELL
jgi:hypothetical protein